MVLVKKKKRHTIIKNVSVVKCTLCPFRWHECFCAKGVMSEKVCEPLHKQWFEEEVMHSAPKQHQKQGHAD